MNLQKKSAFKVCLHLFFVLMCICYIVPLLLVISASFTSEDWLTSGNGFSLFPQDFSLEAYQTAFYNTERMVRAYGVTFAQAALGTVCSCMVSAMAAYSLSRSNFRFKKAITAIIFFTMLYSAGMIPNYIIFSKYYHLTDSFWIYILPSITGGAWNTMVFRTFFRGLPESLFESARLDGAKELRIFSQIVLPLSTPVFATVGFMSLVSRWNDYSTSMIYIRSDELFTLQYLLQRLVENAEFLKMLADSGLAVSVQSYGPIESLKFAMCVIAAGPMLVVFPFFQKYFSQGLTIGAVKG